MSTACEGIIEWIYNITLCKKNEQQKKKHFAILMFDQKIVGQYDDNGGLCKRA